MLALIRVAIPGHSEAAICAGVDLPDFIERDGTLVLNGMGLRIATIFNFRVYVAGLYVPEFQSDAEQIISNDQQRVLEDHYRHLYLSIHCTHPIVAGSYDESHSRNINPISLLTRPNVSL